VDEFLRDRNVSPQSKINDRLALSRFFAWCIERPRRYLLVNPCAAVRVERGETGPPAILNVPECEALLRAAEADGGRAIPYLVVCLFAALRPFEASRLEWSQVNLADREIALAGKQAKTGRGRVVDIDDTLAAWLQAYPQHPFNVGRRVLDKVRVAAGFVGRINADPSGNPLKPWPADVLRHTGVSHFFRRSGSYGLTAEFAGNSEAIIKQHYQGRVTSDETTRFYALRPQAVGQIELAPSTG
jgi:integrase